MILHVLDKKQIGLYPGVNNHSFCTVEADQTSHINFRQLGLDVFACKNSDAHKIQNVIKNHQ